MATTRLFAELLIIGLGVAIWLGFLIAIGLGVEWTGVLPELGATRLTALVGVAYVLGIVIDRAAYAVFRRREQREKDRVFAGLPADVTPDDMERYILVHSEPLREQILYNRSRIRVTRSWILNFLLIGVLSGGWVIQHRAWELVPLPAGALVLSALTAATAFTLARDHCNNVLYSYRFLTGERVRDVVD